MRGLGTVVNVATVVAGTGVGLLAGARLPERLRITVLQGVGLATVALASFLPALVLCPVFVALFAR